MDAFDHICGEAAGGSRRDLRVKNREPMAARPRSVVPGQPRCSKSYRQLAHRSPPVSSRPNMRFMFWMAWPEAPLTRLSKAAVMIASVPEAETEMPIWQWLV